MSDMTYNIGNWDLEKSMGNFDEYTFVHEVVAIACVDLCFIYCLCDSLNPFNILDLLLTFTFKTLLLWTKEYT